MQEHFYRKTIYVGPFWKFAEFEIKKPKKKSSLASFLGPETSLVPNCNGRSEANK